MGSHVSQYQGREQSYIKHCFLTQYLQAAAYKILQGRSRIFNFVDAFAGPWRVSQDDCSDASFHQALRTLNAVRTDLESSGLRGLKIRYCLCERRFDSADQLERYAKEHSDCDIVVFRGAFEGNLDHIANACRDGFTFTFIDPTGWNIRSGPILDFLKRLGGEFLLNFMAEPVNRHAGYLAVSESFGRFLADPDWEDQFQNLPDEWSNEKRVLHMLKRQIKSRRAATLLPDFPILNPTENRVKMRLILGTHSERGLEVFRKVQKRIERLQTETRHQLKEETQTQKSLFSPDEVAALEQELTGVGCRPYRKESESLVVRALRHTTSSQFSTLAGPIMEEVPMQLTDLKKLLVDMKN